MTHRYRREILSSKPFVGSFLALFVLCSIVSPSLASWTVISVAGRDGDLLLWMLLTGTYTLLLTVLGGLCSYHLAGWIRGRR